MDEYIGTIVAWAPDFAPQGWMLCNGQLLEIRNYQALYALLGTRYGGNGTTTFALPNLCGRVAIGAGKSSEGTIYPIGQTGGSEAVTLTENQLPAHTHPIPANSNPGSTGTPAAKTCLAKVVDADENQIPVYTTAVANTSMAPTGSNTGGKPHTNLQPYTVLNYIICVEGIFPPRP
ncbi:MAG: Phage Tail Collar Domain protein [Eubacterium sp.]|nr:Phage Tail Collar Domain protein [Eubacterium sp.]